MVKPVCPLCGRESEGVCLDCFLEKKPIEAGEVEVRYCECNKVLFKGEWGADEDKKVMGLVKSSVRIPRDLNVLDMDVSVNKERTSGLVHIDFEYNGSVYGRDLNVI